MSKSAFYDAIIIGSGPAAYSAALYLNERLVLLLAGNIIGNNGPGGQLTTTTAVDNYPGFPCGISGPQLMTIMKKQAQSDNFCIKGETATAILEDSNFTVKTTKNVYSSRAVIIATGAQARRLIASGTDTFWQRGISMCAICDGYIFLNKAVAVIGGGDSAMEECLYLAGIASKVYLIHRRDEFRSRKDMFFRAEKNEKITIIRSSVLIEAKGEGVLKSIIIKDIKNEETREIFVEGVFVAIGHLPNTGFIDNSLIKMDDGYIITDDFMKTSKEGIFACGDVQDRVYKQANTAAASGCLAALSAIEYFKKKKDVF